MEIKNKIFEEFKEKEILNIHTSWKKVKNF